MAKSLHLINVIDIEATCWEGEVPLGERSEIVEIGIAQLNVLTLNIEKCPTIIVKPRLSKVSPFCTQLTGLTQGDVDLGVSFDYACSVLRTNYNGPMFPWASYGDYDRGMFQRSCEFWEVAYPFASRHINVKTLAGAYRALDHEVGMDAMLDNMKLTLEGQHHRAGDDAYNIAKILKQVFWKARYGLHYKEEGD